MREVVRQVQNARKEAALNVDDRIRLNLKSDEKILAQAIEEHLDTIKQETLAEEMTASELVDFSREVKIEGALLTISISKT
jgi:isoleucyl-tRNA synthetase